MRPQHLLRVRFRPLLAAAGLPEMRFHDLRHSAATLMLGQAVHPKIVGEMLGHSQTGITMDLYSHVTPTMQEQALRALDALLGIRLAIKRSPGRCLQGSKHRSALVAQGIEQRFPNSLRAIP